MTPPGANPGATERLGGRIPRAFGELLRAGLGVREADEDGATRWQIDKPRYTVAVVLDPGRAIGLTVEVTDRQGDRLSHATDTDLYDISLPRYQKFAHTIEADIAEFLSALAARR